MELKRRKENVLCLIVAGLFDLRVRGQLGDLRVSRFFQSGEEEGQCG